MILLFKTLNLFPKKYGLYLYLNNHFRNPLILFYLETIKLKGKLHSFVILPPLSAPKDIISFFTIISMLCQLVLGSWHGHFLSSNSVINLHRISFFKIGTSFLWERRLSVLPRWAFRPLHSNDSPVSTPKANGWHYNHCSIVLIVVKTKKNTT